MATYSEIRQLFNDDTLRNRVTVATVIAANSALASNPTAAQQKFANMVFSSPEEMGRKVLMAVLASNSTYTLAQIQGVTDAALQTAVAAVVPNLTAAIFGV